MKTDLFDYPLPEHLIAQTPAQQRDASRLLVVHRAERRIEHRHFREIGDYLRAGDTLFRNNAAVIPARLHARRPTGGAVECLLLRPVEFAAGTTALENQNSRSAVPGIPGNPHSAFRIPQSAEWWCLLRPGRKLPPGETFALAGHFTATVREKNAEGLFRVAFACESASDILGVANRIGEMPLPPYIGERHDDTDRARDRERYQTVYADRAHQVAAAAPTAGLHFTPQLLAQLAGAGVRFADVTLHVGLGTFRPIAAEHVEDHVIHREIYEVPAATQTALFASARSAADASADTASAAATPALASGPTSASARAPSAARRIAVGTTSLRTLEDFRRRHTAPLGRDFLGEADIFIHPPATFAAVDALITNFHQPRSTLLCLVAAFLAPGSTDGVAWSREIYAEAAARGYRFLSYGDAMLIV
ncbi:MAG: S-adenosylmethionine:tRNA ribosyltransferase-isomerase [Opitutae bacterium]|nr:S-adenosylmethionine:tRNA ribosyltransferase-isomerase [Opitutae bacterium]